MTTDNLLALALRVEREEPSDELHWCIQEAVHPEWRRTTAEPYTTSLDAAASLMPPGWVVNDVNQSIHGFWYIRLWPADPSAIGMSEGNAPTEPRARTAAALRARAQEARDDG